FCLRVESSSSFVKYQYLGTFIYCACYGYSLFLPPGKIITSFVEHGIDAVGPFGYQVAQAGHRNSMVHPVYIYFFQCFSYGYIFQQGGIHDENFLAYIAYYAPPVGYILLAKWCTIYQYLPF